MHQQQPPQWQPPRPRQKKPVPRWVWFIVGGWVLVFGFVASAMAAGVIDPPKDQAAPTGHAAPSTTSAAPSPKTSRTTPASPVLSARVTKAHYGVDWPFVHIMAGTVRCIPRGDAPGEVVFVGDDGRTFGLNGTALDGGYSDIPKSEWRKDPRYPGTDVYVGIGPLRDPVAKACGLSVPS